MIGSKRKKTATSDGLSRISRLTNYTLLIFKATSDTLHRASIINTSPLQGIFHSLLLADRKLLGKA